MAIDLTELGMTQEELRERVVEVIADRFINIEGGYFSKALTDLVRERLNISVKEIAEKHILPQVSQYVENLTLEETNRWGEAVGERITFTEYLVKRAEAYLREEVNPDGKSKNEMRDSCGWYKSQTRIAHLVHEHLHYSIAAAMKDAVGTVQSVVSKGLQDTVKMKLDEISKGLKISVQTK